MNIYISAIILCVFITLTNLVINLLEKDLSAVCDWFVVVLWFCLAICLYNNIEGN